MIILITLPLIPLFMILVGLMTKDRTTRKLGDDEPAHRPNCSRKLIAGLPTLRAF